MRPFEWIIVVAIVAAAFVAVKANGCVDISIDRDVSRTVNLYLIRQVVPKPGQIRRAWVTARTENEALELAAQRLGPKWVERVSVAEYPDARRSRVIFEE